MSELVQNNVRFLEQESYMTYADCKHIFFYGKFRFSMLYSKQNWRKK